MGSKTARLRRNQLDRFFSEHKTVLLGKTPKSGWVREVRQALGMTMQDLGARLGVIKQRIERIEKDEGAGKLTVQTLQETAEALNCEFVYFFVPKGEGLQKALEEQARKTARDIVRSTEYTMQLEAQDTSRQSQQQLQETLTQELLNKEDRRIWRRKSEDSKPTRRNSPRR